jgi:alkyl hydroperoxide reductase subunit AhpC
MSIQIGRPAPAFNKVDALLPDGSFGQVSLSDYKGKWVILFFYPLDFTFNCPTEITQFSDNAARFAELNTQVIGCSVDSKFSHLAWASQPRNKGGLGKTEIPILSDLTRKISTDYNVLITEGEDAGVALRGTFLIDPAGILRQITVNDLPVSRNVEEVIRLLQGFQYHAKTGDVVPCNWKPGGRTMKADPKLSQEYFSAIQ